MTESGTGWIKLHRQFIESRLFSRSGNTVKVAIYLLLSANHKSRFVRGIKIECGQCVRSISQISEACHISRKAARYAIDQMEKESFMTKDEPFGAQQGHRITICNYDSYQNGKGSEGTEGSNEGSNEGNTNKNDKNEKNDITPSAEEASEPSDKKQKRFTAPTEDEVRAYVLERGSAVDPQTFVDFYAAKGWMIGKNKVKDWKACVRTWEKRNPKPKDEEYEY